MIIECPSCMTRFRLDESRVSGLRPLLKCSRCQHIFPLPGGPPRETRTAQPPPRPPAEQKPPRRRVPPAQAEPTNLSFPFGEEEDEWRDDSTAEDTVAEEQFSLTESDALADQADAAIVSRDEIAERADDAGPGGGGISLRPVFVFLLLVVSSYAVLAATIYANPDFTDQIVRSVPLMGSGSGGMINRNVLLMDIQGGYERTRAGKDIFVVTGYAVNQAEFSLNSIQVRVQLLDSGGNLLHERIVFCGSTVPRKLLRDLTGAEVSVLGRLKPPRTLLIHPGERSPFMAVFADPRPAVAELSTHVAAAQRQL